MATHAHQVMGSALIRSFKVGTAVTKGQLVKFDGADDTVTDCASGEQGLGVALATSTTAGDFVTVALLAGATIVQVKLAGTVARGAYMAAGTGGFVSQAAGGGTVVKHIAGLCMQSGVSGDFVGMLACPMVTATA